MGAKGEAGLGVVAGDAARERRGRAGEVVATSVGMDGGGGLGEGEKEKKKEKSGCG
jgi:hypothetical protein